MSNSQNPLAQIPVAERQLIASLEAAARALDTVGADPLAQAVAKVQLSAARATDRILQARTVALTSVGALTNFLDGISGDFFLSLGDFSNELIDLSAPAVERTLQLSVPAPVYPNISDSPLPPEDEVIDLAANAVETPVAKDTAPEPLKKAKRGRKTETEPK